MSYEVVCPNGHKLRVEASHVGRKAKCSKCGVVFTVPDVTSEAASPEQPMELEPQESQEENAPMSAQPAQGSARGSAAPPPIRSRRKPPSFMGISPGAAQAMLLIGLVLVLFARGWDAVGTRGIARAKAKIDLEKSGFYNKWEDRQMEIREDIEELEEKDDLDSDDRDELRDLRDDLEKAQREMRKEEREREKDEWRDLQRAASTASKRNQAMGYWREILFVLGTIVLTLGLITTGTTGEGAERWVCLLMLAIITFSVYVGGIAWLASILNIVR
ncbi:MAG: hypothetical protein ACLF0G_10020 [Candidatus Brocadiia bacterium]